MITTYNKILYFGFNFDWKSTLSLRKLQDFLSLIVRDPLRGTTAIFCVQDLI